MKDVKKFFAVLCVLLTVGASLAFVGCTDKDNERELDSTEELILGRWKNGYGTELLFRYDGTVRDSHYNTFTFRHTGTGDDPRRGEYEEITIYGNSDYPGSNRYALFHIQTNGKIRLCFIDIYNKISEFDALPTYEAC